MTGPGVVPVDRLDDVVLVTSAGVVALLETVPVVDGLCWVVVVPAGVELACAVVGADAVELDGAVGCCVVTGVVPAAVLVDDAVVVLSSGTVVVVTVGIVSVTWVLVGPDVVLGGVFVLVLRSGVLEGSEVAALLDDGEEDDVPSGVVEPDELVVSCDVVL